MRLYSIYDTVSELWAPPFIQENDRSAQRSFDQLKAQNPAAASDVKLVCLGFWDPKVLSPLDALERPEEVTVAAIMKEMEHA